MMYTCHCDDNRWLGDSVARPRGKPYVARAAGRIARKPDSIIAGLPPVSRLQPLCTCDHGIPLKGRYFYGSGGGQKVQLFEDRRFLMSM